jgi:sugar lactone lactonase YvrE
MPDPKTLLTGLAIGESPRWHQDRLWFAHWGTNEIVAVDLDGHSEVVGHAPATIGYSIDWLPDGRLLVTAGTRLLQRTRPGGSWEPYAELGHLARGWSELVVDGRGNTYVNGSDFDFLGGGPFVPGVIALVTPDGSVRQIADGIEFPNGMVVTPDNATLIIAESFASRLTAFDIADDGSLSNRRVWAELGEGGDGISLDTEGAVWTPVGGREQPPAFARVREGGEVAQRIEVGQSGFACMLGGPDRRTLFMLVADWRGTENVQELIADRTGQVLSVQAPAAGAGWP